MSLNITTISKLPSLTTESLNSNDLFWISHPDSGQKYISKNTSLSAITNYAKNDVKDSFQLDGMNVAKMNYEINNTLSGDITFKGVKTFESTPKITGQTGNLSTLADDSILTKKNIATLANNLIADGITMVASNSKTQRNPENNTPYTNKDNVDFSLTIDNGKNVSNVQRCNSDGQLVVYGWTADGGRVLPQEAWVAIYGKLNGIWTILQLHPWVVSQNSSILQYVGFNVPVKNGLEIRIQTGFPVNMTASGFNTGNTLTFNDGSINTFVGYIIKKSV